MNAFLSNTSCFYKQLAISSAFLVKSQVLCCMIVPTRASINNRGKLPKTIWLIFRTKALVTFIFKVSKKTWDWTIEIEKGRFFFFLFFVSFVSFRFLFLVSQNPAKFSRKEKMPDRNSDLTVEWRALEIERVCEILFPLLSFFKRQLFL